MKRLLALASVPAVLLLGMTPALALQDSWDMTANMNDVVGESGGSQRDIVMHEVTSHGQTGNWNDLMNSVEFTDAPAWGEAANTNDRNPGTSQFALGARVTVDFPTVTEAPDYSGNVVQKGLYTDGMQVKLQVVRDNNGGHFECRFDAANTSATNAPIVESTVRHVGDGESHVAYCYRDGGTIGIFVDGTYSPDPDNTTIGSFAVDRNVFVGNKGTGTSAQAEREDQHFGKNQCTAYGYGSSSDVDWVRAELNDADNNC